MKGKTDKSHLILNKNGDAVGESFNKNTKCKKLFAAKIDHRLKVDDHVNSHMNAVINYEFSPG